MEAMEREGNEASGREEGERRTGLRQRWQVGCMHPALKYSRRARRYRRLESSLALPQWLSLSQLAPLLAEASQRRILEGGRCNTTRGLLLALL